MADLIYDHLSEILGDGSIDMDDDTFRMALFTDSHVPDPANTQYSQLAGEVPAGGGYTTGGKDLTTTIWLRTGNVTRFSSDPVEWTSASFTCRYGVIYDVTHVNDLVLLLYDFVTNQTVNGTFTLTPNAGGWFDNSPV